MLTIEPSIADCTHGDGLRNTESETKQKQFQINMVSVFDTAFYVLDLLQILKMNRNNLIKMQAKSISFLPSFYPLEIRRNRISSLDADSFLYLGHLAELDLSENKLLSLSDKSMHFLGSSFSSQYRSLSVHCLHLSNLNHLS